MNIPEHEFEALKKQAESKLDPMAQKLETVAKNEESKIKILKDIQFLNDSETKLLELIFNNNPSPDTPGEIECGPINYFIFKYLPDLPGGERMLEALKFLGLRSKIFSENLWPTIEAKIKGDGIVTPDGSIIATSKYNLADYHWAVAALEYLNLKHLHIGLEYFSPFPGNPQTVTVPDDVDELRIVVVGDWGTGVWQDGDQSQCPSEAVLSAIKNLDPQPHYIIHLGDVYYAGTESLGEGQLLFPGEENNNFVKLWHPGLLGSFTLNSNHEMYNGANGLFKDALGWNKSPQFSGPFSLQKGASYFALEFADWILFGLDSGYYDESSLFMDGSIGNDTDTQQRDFLRSFDLTGANKNKKVMVMTHHTGMDTYGKTLNNPLWDQVCEALGPKSSDGSWSRTPDMWYWGHIHNGIVYSNESAAGDSTLCRCMGHGALPFGNGYALHQPGNPNANIKEVSYYTHTPLPGSPNRVLNGFAQLTFKPNGGISEQIIDQTGKVAWTNDTQVSV